MTTHDLTSIFIPIIFIGLVGLYFWYMQSQSHLKLGENKIFEEKNVKIIMVPVLSSDKAEKLFTRYCYRDVTITNYRIIEKYFSIIVGRNIVLPNAKNIFGQINVLSSDKIEIIQDSNNGKCLQVRVPRCLGSNILGPVMLKYYVNDVESIEGWLKQSKFE